MTSVLQLSHMRCINQGEQSLNLNILNLYLTSPQSPGPTKPKGGRWPRALCACRTGDPLHLDLWSCDGDCTVEALTRANLQFALLRAKLRPWNKASGETVMHRLQGQSWGQEMKENTSGQRIKKSHIFLTAQNSFFTGFYALFSYFTRLAALRLFCLLVEL